MTRTKYPVRAALLVLLVVVSTTAGALAGSAGATSTATLEDAVEYGGTIELALDSPTASPVQPGDVEVRVDGDSRSVDVAADGTDGRIVLTGLDDVGPQETLVVEVDSGDLSTGEVPVQVTGSVLEAGQESNFFKGADIAYVASAEDVTFDLYEGDTLLVRRATGPNSKVYVIDTDDAQVGQSYSVRESDGAEVRTDYHIRPLDLTATANRTQVPGGGAVEVSATSRGADRPMLYRLRDASSGDVVATREVHMDGSGEASGTFADLSSGTYEVVVEDAITGITARTDAISVGQTQEGDVSLARKVLVEQRGDVLDVPLSFAGPAAGGFAEVTLGSPDVYFEVTVTVEDTDGDGTATIRWNTADSTNATAGVWVQGGQGEVAVETGVDDPVVTGEYPVSVSYAGSETDVGTAVLEARTTDGVSVLTAPASASGFERVTEVKSTASGTDAVAMDRLTLSHDWLIVRVRASGLGGYVDTAGDLDGTSGLSLTVLESESSVTANEDRATVDLGDARLLAAPGEDTYYLVTQPLIPRNGEIEPGDEFEVTFAVDGSENPVTDGTQEATTTFTVVNGTASVDDDPLRLPAAVGATVTGDSTFAPGTELTVTLRSTGGQSPFVVDRSVVVGSDGTWSASFDLSEYDEGTDFVARVSKADRGRVAVEGELVGETTPTAGVTDDGTDRTPTRTATADTQPTTTTSADSPTGGEGTSSEITPTTTPSPGFGPLVALLGTLLAILLARRE